MIAACPDGMPTGVGLAFGLVPMAMVVGAAVAHILTDVRARRRHSAELAEHLRQAREQAATAEARIEAIHEARVEAIKDRERRKAEVVRLRRIIGEAVLKAG